MDVFKIHEAIMGDYQSFIKSFIHVSDNDILETINQELDSGKLWPPPLIQFNPSFDNAENTDDLIKEGTLCEKMKDIFAGFRLYRHQVDAMRLGCSGRDFIVTSGTGSGKSLTYIGSIFNHILRSAPDNPEIQAIIVYPMNALINSQTEELDKFKNRYEETLPGRSFPIRYAQYTGQEDNEKREAIRTSRPHILLTNYMMLELILTRINEKRIRESIYKSLRFLVFDELHTYRGRQGSDVGLLIRRIRARCENELTCIGTSATMVSGGTIQEQKESIVTVAGKIFGKPFRSDQIIQEKLARCFDYMGSIPDPRLLAETVTNPVPPNAGLDSLKTFPTAIWLENRIALTEKEGELVRNKPLRFREIATLLANDTNLEYDSCEHHLHELMMWIARVNLTMGTSRYTWLPFRLHQFISQTGSVYTTLHSDDQRLITLEPSPFSVVQDVRQPLFPNVFSRISGHSFICVHLNKEANRLEPREFRQYGDDDEVTIVDGYIIPGDDVWDPERDLEELPDSWLRFDKQGVVTRVTKKYESRIPSKIWFDAEGNFSFNQGNGSSAQGNGSSAQGNGSSAQGNGSFARGNGSFARGNGSSAQGNGSFCSGLPYHAWYMPAPLLFDPTCGVVFDIRTSEGTKLARLGSEGRSSSTTILSLAVLKQLAAAGLDPADRKLLSFTDNRQDAALQSGHFNDFMDVVRIRSAVVQALKHAENGQLTFRNIGKSIFDALHLPVLEYANTREEPMPWAATKYNDALQNYLVYRAIHDLRRGWRVNVPNLEHCALLSIGYQHLDVAAAAEPLWADLPLMRDLDESERRDMIFRVLDYFRQSYAVSSETWLSERAIGENFRDIQENLKDPWKFASGEKIASPDYLRVRRLHDRANIFNASIGSNSRLGKYVRAVVADKGCDPGFNTRNYNDFMAALLVKLEQAGFLLSKLSRDKDNAPIPVYQLKLSTIIWMKGDEQSVIPDIVRMRAFRRNLSPVPNAYFKSLYTVDFAGTAHCFQGADHTGQLQNADRIQREAGFGAGKISALFCSPTMELGIDIKNLSVVHMRNAPPNPANYAQRSGRAGRSGQGALVFTYCGSYSSHDRHFFSNQTEMVAGSVKPANLDLINEEQVRAHLHAIYLAETGLQEMNTSIADIVDLQQDTYPLDSGVVEKLRINAATTQLIRTTFQRVIDDIRSGTASSNSLSWLTDEWISRTLQQAPQRLNEALERWRALYRDAMALIYKSTQVITSGRYTLQSKEYRQADREQKQATRQLDLLKNQADHDPFSEFYPFRYFAAEGFLPGYNFTRLPIRTFVQIGNGGEYISRPRRIALREFGPQNILYHKGIKYKMNQMIVQDAGNMLENLKICKSSGFLLRGEHYKDEICPLTKTPLNNDEVRDIVTDVLEMRDTRCVETARISCEEEERLARGYRIETYFSVDGSMERLMRAFLKFGDEILFNITFLPAARIYLLNRGWRGQREEGFALGLTSGIWYRQAVLEDPGTRDETIRTVKLLTWNTADALYLEPMQALGLDRNGVITLEFALKRAIEKVFHVEQAEIDVCPIGGDTVPNIFFHESAEGSLGILSQFVTDVDAYRKIVDEAIRICRYDDETYDKPASYDDLLSYYNQRYHSDIDRHLIRDALLKMQTAHIEIQTNPAFTDYEDHYRTLIRQYDTSSSTERTFLDYLYQNGLRLPDAAQKEIPGIYVRPDFYYRDRIWVFCDGSPHDRTDVQAEDAGKRAAIRNRGDDVVVWHYRTDLKTLVDSRPDIFYKVR